MPGLEVGVTATRPSLSFLCKPAPDRSYHGGMLTTALLLLATAVVNPALTPGAVRPLSLATVCTTKWGIDQRHVSKAKKARVYKAYGIPLADRHLYVIDHLISREISGSDEIFNLWPELVAEAKIKDRIEKKLHVLACQGTITMQAAQQEIRTDWRVAYEKYLGEVPPRLPQ